MAPRRARPIDEFNSFSDELKVVVEPSRLRVLNLLSREPFPGKTTEEIASTLHVSKSTIHQHLITLAEAGLVKVELGHAHRYTPVPSALFRLVTLMSRTMGTFMDASDPVPGDTLSGALALGGPAAAFRRAGPQFVVVRGWREGTSFPLPSAGDVMVGRGPSCGVRLDWDPWISQEHAVVVAEGAAHRVEDLRSKHGTLVNGEFLDRPGAHLLGVGDILQVGFTTLVYR